MYWIMLFEQMTLIWLCVALMPSIKLDKTPHTHHQAQWWRGGNWDLPGYSGGKYEAVCSTATGWGKVGPSTEPWSWAPQQNNISMTEKHNKHVSPDLNQLEMLLWDLKWALHEQRTSTHSSNVDKDWSHTGNDYLKLLWLNMDLKKMLNQWVQYYYFFFLVLIWAFF